MGQSRVISFLLSLCLHTGVFAAILFWPEPYRPPVDLNAPLIDLDLTTIGRPGGPPVQPAKPKTPEPPKAAPEAPKPVPDKTTTPPPDTKKPEPAPMKPAPVTPPPDVKTITDTPKKPEPPVNATKTAAPEKPKEKPEDVLKKALGDLGKTATRPSGGGRPDPKALDRALGEFKKSGAGDTVGDGPGGDGGDGVGVLGSYQQSLASRIKPHWEYAGRADRKNPTAVATISIAKDGAIIDAAIAQSSGDTAFDGSVLKAVRDTVRVEPPPTPALMKVNITFAYEALAAGR